MPQSQVASVRRHIKAVNIYNRFGTFGTPLYRGSWNFTRGGEHSVCPSLLFLRGPFLQALESL
jgi:hypothetical protein